jgi:ABC-type glycerol-3-phosphate transport system permease component
MIAEVSKTKSWWAARVGRSAFAIALMLMNIGPVIWLFSVSVKTKREYAAHPFGVPSAPSLDNYVFILSDSAFLRFAWNSLLVTTSSVLIILVLSTLAAYALARLDFAGNRLPFIAYLFGEVIPLFLILLPLYVLLAKSGLGGTLFSLILAYTAASLGISTLVLRSYFRSIPTDLEDAAKIDGCNTISLVWHVMMPLVRPGLVVVAVFNIFNIWNEYLLAPFLLPSQKLFTLPAGLASSFVAQYATNWPAMAAGIVFSAIPLILMFVAAQDKIVEGFSFGSK